ncbi:hypothetical protein BGZ97_001514 [Linnemannia gamsii]|uniref:Uncharacterized protein n=1 Tax=Linnemannia gamsii TaxID=64522 RepID=A0A9P6R0D1_9FUNG|nr:hypothetical protein BGZ97_001514 [Linnemannia gamsii]
MGNIESGTMIVEQGETSSEGREETLPEGDEESISEEMAREAKVRETKRLRTVTVPLKNIVRKELAQQKVYGSPEDLEKETMAADKLHETLQNKQVILTNAVDELASQSE